jgi:tRNA modification GTPase
MLLRVFFFLMPTPTYSLDDAIVALATPLAESALAVIRTSGPGSIELVASAFSRFSALKAASGNTLVHGFILAADGGLIDEVVLGVYRAPHGYTGEDSIEVFCHGSIPGVGRVIERLLEVGFRRAKPGEFTLRAFANGRMDLTRAEAVSEVIAAHTEESRMLALRRLSGALADRVGELKSGILAALAAVEVQLDYAEDDAAEDIELDIAGLGSIERSLRALASTAGRARLFRDGARVAIAGRTNAGKSSLFNLLLREDRSIVSDVHGTTRDYIEEWLDVAGVPVSLFDTAGLREPGDRVEAAGIERSGRVIGSAAVVLYLVDATGGLDDGDRDFLASHCDYTAKTGVAAGPVVIPIWNKVDREVPASPPGFIPVSVKKGEGVDHLLSVLGSVLLEGSAGGSSADGVTVASERQQALLERAADSLASAIASHRAGEPLDLVAPDLRDAVDALGEMTGEVSTADMLEEIFSRFCVGK